MMACAIAHITRHANPPLAKYFNFPWKIREEVARALPATPKPHLTPSQMARHYELSILQYSLATQPAK